MYLGSSHLKNVSVGLTEKIFLLKIGNLRKTHL